MQITESNRVITSFKQEKESTDMQRHECVEELEKKRTENEELLANLNVCQEHKTDLEGKFVSDGCMTPRPPLLILKILPV